MLKIKQITPAELFSNRNHLDDYLKEEFGGLVSEKTWITDWE
ncbi:hypothetical protein [Metabacillus lacus]|nr:hypothetical protein [Metabacillus lacus]